MEERCNNINNMSNHPSIRDAVNCIYCQQNNNDAKRASLAETRKNTPIYLRHMLPNADRMITAAFSKQGLMLFPNMWTNHLSECHKEISQGALVPLTT